MRAGRLESRVLSVLLMTCPGIRESIGWTKRIIMTRGVFVLCGVMVGCAVAGCGKKAEPSAAKPAESSSAEAAAPAAEQQTATAQTTPPDTVDLRGASLVATAPLSPGTQIVPVPLTDPNNITSTLAELTQALRKYSFDQRRLPKSFSEVIAAGYVKPTPAPPPGKKFEVDAKTKQVVLVNR
jgi:hypothetical protein